MWTRRAKKFHPTKWNKKHWVPNQGTRVFSKLSVCLNTWSKVSDVFQEKIVQSNPLIWGKGQPGLEYNPNYNYLASYEEGLIPDMRSVAKKKTVLVSRVFNRPRRTGPRTYLSSPHFYKLCFTNLSPTIFFIDHFNFLVTKRHFTVYQSRTQGFLASPILG